VNFVGFVPFGLVLVLLVRSRYRYTIAVAGGAGLSAVIEVLQLGIVLRYPSVTDFVLNVSGCLFGAIVAKIMLSKSAVAKCKSSSDSVCAEHGT
jgi:glycopeptide antibiotics resistance protein